MRASRGSMGGTRRSSGRARWCSSPPSRIAVFAVRGQLGARWLIAPGAVFLGLVIAHGRVLARRGRLRTAVGAVRGRDRSHRRSLGGEGRRGHVISGGGGDAPLRRGPGSVWRGWAVRAAERGARADRARDAGGVAAGAGQRGGGARPARRGGGARAARRSAPGSGDVRARGEGRGARGGADRLGGAGAGRSAGARSARGACCWRWSGSPRSRPRCCGRPACSVPGRSSARSSSAACWCASCDSRSSRSSPASTTAPTS